MTQKYYSTAAAASKLGVSIGTVQAAIKRGVLKAKMVRHPIYKKRSVYLVSERSLSEYAASDRRPGQRTTWTEDIDAAILELDQSCTAAQIAQYLGLTKKQIDHRRSLLLATGARDATPTKRKNPLPFAMPRSGILVAKSCVRCGRMRDARYFWKCVNSKFNHDYHFPECRLCANKKKRGRPQNKHTVSRKRDKLFQQVTTKLATNHQAEWTQHEESKISDMSKSEFDLAIELGRTYLAVRSRRTKLGLYPDRRLHLADSYWKIDFPAAQAALENHFKELGQPVPENLWEWSDSDIAIPA